VCGAVGVCGASLVLIYSNSRSFRSQVAPEYAGCGLGRRMMEQVQAIAKSLSPAIPKVTLTVFKANLSAIKFYAKLGYGVDLNIDPHPNPAAHYFILSRPVHPHSPPYDAEVLKEFIYKHKHSR